MTQEARYKDLMAKYKKLSDNAIKINTQIEQAAINRQRILEQAQNQFGESDVVKLEELAQKLHEENEKTLNDLEETIKSKEEEIKQKEDIIQKIQQG